MRYTRPPRLNIPRGLRLLLGRFWWLVDRLGAPIPFWGHLLVLEVAYQRFYAHVFKRNPLWERVRRADSSLGRPP